jgi:hypothetical protein
MRVDSMTDMNEEERQAAGIPLFKDKKVKDGWVLNLFKQNEEILSTSLYNQMGQMVENKAFLTQTVAGVEMLAEYIALFDEDPEKNYKKMMRINVR